MPNIIEGMLNASGERFCIIVSRFNEFITSKLLSGAVDELIRHGANDSDIDVIWVPGAFEIPLFAKKAAKAGKYNAIIALGAVIKGSTSHYDYVCAEVSKGVASVSINTGIPVIFGVLTCDNIEQAIERAGTKSGNKGVDAARTAIETADLARKVLYLLDILNFLFIIKKHNVIKSKGRLAQLVEHHIDIVGVTGSSPVPPTIYLKGFQ